jgi:hypothetical protein
MEPYLLAFLIMPLFQRVLPKFKVSTKKYDKQTQTLASVSFTKQQTPNSSQSVVSN